MDASDLETEFKKAADKAFSLPKQSNENLLKLYALYKQATEGDVSGERPGMLKIKERAKFDAWAKLRGKEQAKSKKEYIYFVKELGS